MRAEFEQILRYWFDRGVTGFRIDVAHGLIKDRELRDGVRYMRERPEVHEIYAGWQAIAREYDPKPTLMGETYVKLRSSPVLAAPRPRAELRIHRAEFDLDELRPIVETTRGEAARRRDAALVRLEPRPLAARDALGRRRRAQGARRALPAADAAGRRILFQGDEIALEDGKVPADRITDLADPPRDPERTPLPWTRSGEEWHEPWLPLATRSATSRISAPTRRARSTTSAT